MAGLVIGLAVLGGWFWVAITFAAILLCFRELRDILKATGINPSQIIVYSVAVLMVVVSGFDKPQFLAPILTLALMASFFRLIFRTPRATTSDIGGTLISVFYIAYLPVHFILLRNLGIQPDQLFWQQPGLIYVVFTIVVIGTSDIAAYYAGKAFGKNPFAPAISPKKTREGALAGVLGGLLAGVLVASLTQFPVMHAVILGVLLVIVGQLGDLTESLMKRDSGLKDSGVLLAGHGGLLDRADSYLFSGAVSYYYIYWVVLEQGLALDIHQWLQQLALL